MEAGMMGDEQSRGVQHFIQAESDQENMSKHPGAQKYFSEFRGWTLTGTYAEFQSTKDRISKRLYSFVESRIDNLAYKDLMLIKN